MQPTIGDNIGTLRRSGPMTQEALAEAAGVSVETIRKLEQNERTSARMSTLNRLARALGVPTSALVGNASQSAARGEADHDEVALLELRRALTPARGIRGATVGGPEVEPPTLADVRDAVAGLDRAYHLDDYAMTLAGLPLLIAEARSAVAETEGDAQAEALALLDGAAAAAVRIGDRVPAASLSPGPATIGAFCRTTVEWKRVESAVISGHPDRALALSREAPRSNRPTSYNRNRHLLDVAAAHAQTGAYSEATAVLLDLRDHAPAWLRHQRYARDIVGTITSARRKAMSQELADLATLVGTDL